ncbi:hypothetical protein [Maribacter cobaltidurans]|uniref:Uncharacterized protein n=1 Tax=Maribacter cobaltidurans TaxID=1178778 RepID=A0A223V4I8_9FLAO|nr:hypothetical protein [Maribacter cobaltidurans]ASV29759.1 hypothetical protein CJ263_05735 [Maribacter cobaltidurans]GGD92791.1 hypothetical protein GCM10011412_33440 [Maribacter cobaltidurans]
MISPLQSFFMKSHLIIFFIFFSLKFGFCQGEKSRIQITNPSQATVWNIPQEVSLEWTTENIGPEKSIRFFLVRNEMVVQELGSFKNTGSAIGIELAKNIGSGNQYQVVGIELFPDDKYNIAKFVTPFFSITNKASDERKKKHQMAEEAKRGLTKKERKRNRKEKKEPVQTLSTVPTEESPKPKPSMREQFDGRKISYTEELSFSNENITIKIWDHGRQDGDIVSIYLNGSPVVSKHYLTYYKREFKVKLNPNKSNDLFLYAHNLGDAPPNTVSVEISDGTKSENLILNSDLQSCEAVMISVNK